MLAETFGWAKEQFLACSCAALEAALYPPGRARRTVVATDGNVLTTRRVALTISLGIFPCVHRSDLISRPHQNGYYSSSGQNDCRKADVAHKKTHCISELLCICERAHRFNSDLDLEFQQLHESQMQ